MKHMGVDAVFKAVEILEGGGAKVSVEWPAQLVNIDTEGEHHYTPGDVVRLHVDYRPVKAAIEKGVAEMKEGKVVPIQETAEVVREA
jgi:hypothetical protein